MNRSPYESISSNDDSIWHEALDALLAEHSEKSCHAIVTALSDQSWRKRETVAKALLNWGYYGIFRVVWIYRLAPPCFLGRLVFLVLALFRHPVFEEDDKERKKMGGNPRGVLQESLEFYAFAPKELPFIAAGVGAFGAFGGMVPECFRGDRLRPGAFGCSAVPFGCRFPLQGGHGEGFGHLPGRLLFGILPCPLRE